MSADVALRGNLAVLTVRLERRLSATEQRVALSREMNDALAADLADERRHRENLESDVRRLIERVEALEGTVA